MVPRTPIVRLSTGLTSLVRPAALGPRTARSLLGEARRREREVRLGAEDYADEILATLEVNLGKFLTAVQRGREQLQRRSDEPSALELDE